MQRRNYYLARAREVIEETPPTPKIFTQNQTPPYPHHPKFRSDSYIHLTYYFTLLAIKKIIETMQ